MNGTERGRHWSVWMFEIHGNYAVNVFWTKSLTRSCKKYKNTDLRNVPTQNLTILANLDTEEEPTVIHPIQENVAKWTYPILVEIIWHSGIQESTIGGVCPYFLHMTHVCRKKDSFHESTFISLSILSSFFQDLPRSSNIRRILASQRLENFFHFSKRLRLPLQRFVQVRKAREEICDAQRWDATFLHHQLCGFILYHLEARSQEDLTMWIPVVNVGGTARELLFKLGNWYNWIHPSD